MRKRKGISSKIGALCLVLVVGLGMMGVGVAHWEETLAVEATVETGVWEMQLCDWPPICPGGHSLCPGTDDPPGSGCFSRDIRCYLWGFIPIRGCRDIGSTDIRVVDDDTVRVTLTNVYPGYKTKVWWCMTNTGTIPLKIDSITLENINDPDGLLPHVKAGGHVWIQTQTHWGALEVFNGGYFHPGSLSNMPDALEGKLNPYVIDAGRHVVVGCGEEEDERCLLLVIDSGAPKGATISFDLTMTWQCWAVP